MQGIGSVRIIACVIAVFIGLAQNGVRFSAILRRDGVENQNAVIAAIGDEQTLAVTQGKAGERKRRGAAQRIGRIVIEVVHGGWRGAHYRGFFVRRVRGGLRGGTGKSVIGNTAGQIRLSDHYISGSAVRGRNGIPDQDPVLRQISHEHADTVRGHRNRSLHVAGRGSGLALGKIGLHEGGETGLSDYHVRRGLIGCGNPVIYQNPVVLGVGDEQFAT